MDLEKKASKTILRLKEEKESLEDEVEDLREKIASFERRQQAEEIVLQARECDDAPDRMKAASVERFLALRSKMEDKEDEELEKVATTVSMWKDEEGGIVPSEWSDSREAGDFNEWIRQHI